MLPQNKVHIVNTIAEIAMIRYITLFLYYTQFLSLLRLPAFSYKKVGVKMLMIAAAIMLIIYTTNAAMPSPKVHKAYIKYLMPSIICR